MLKMLDYKIVAVPRKTRLPEGGLKLTDTIIIAFNDTEVRSITEENEIWFALVDVCKILELSNQDELPSGLTMTKRNFKLRLPES